LAQGLNNSTRRQTPSSNGANLLSTSNSWSQSPIHHLNQRNQIFWCSLEPSKVTFGLFLRTCQTSVDQSTRRSQQDCDGPSNLPTGPSARTLSQQTNKQTDELSSSLKGSRWLEGMNSLQKISYKLHNVTLVQKRLVQLISPEYYFHPMQAPYTSLVPLVSTLEHNTTQESH
jgi:hypothetical protein